jgi:hypothetical protein
MLALREKFRDRVGPKDDALVFRAAIGRSREIGALRDWISCAA